MCRHNFINGSADFMFITCGNCDHFQSPVSDFENKAPSGFVFTLCGCTTSLSCVRYSLAFHCFLDAWL